ncbi:unnamed protein product [Lathyrus sativus]|nr:unnamed protein product [Lathyrus sativus]
MYLPLLDDVDKIKQYSWGSATLAHLYHSLCHNSIANTGNWTGCGVLLQSWGWSRMTNLAPIQQNQFEFPFARRWSSLGMNYDNCPHFSITQYRNLIDHLAQEDFIWRPYLGLEAFHQVERQDSAVWSAKVPIINFTTVEMHNSDRVKLQFGMLQDIPCPPKCIPDKYHNGKVSDQWEYNPWTKYAKHECREWRHRTNYVLSDNVFPYEMKQSLQYMTWYRSVSIGFISHPRYLNDPRQQDSSSRPQQPSQPYFEPPTQPQCQPSTQYYFQPPTQPNFQPPSQPHFQPPTQPYFQPPLTQSQPYEHTPNQFTPFTQTHSQSEYQQHPPQYHTYSQFQTPNQPIPTQSFTPIPPYDQAGYRPEIASSSQPPQTNYEGMGNSFDLDDLTDMDPSAWAEVIQMLDDDTVDPTPPQRPPRNVRNRGCGTGGHLNRPSRRN